MAALRETGRVIYPINPLAASRYRARYAVSGAKSDATDAVLLANIVRTDSGAHRPLPADTEAAQAIRVLARAQQDAVWARQQIGNQIRDLLKDFYPAALVAFADLSDGGLARRDARTILAAAPTPAQAAKLTPARLRRLLIKAGRKRYLDRDVARLREVFTDTYLHQPPVVENAMGIHLAALLSQFEAACTAADELAEVDSAVLADLEPTWSRPGWRHLKHFNGFATSFALTPSDITSETLDALWLPETDATVLTIRLISHGGTPEVSAWVRYHTDGHRRGSTDSPVAS